MFEKLNTLEKKIFSVLSLFLLLFYAYSALINPAPTQFHRGIFVLITYILGFLLYKFPRIRGVISLMIILLLTTSLFFILIDLIVMPLKYPDINLIIIRIPVNIALSSILYFPMLLLWYYITIKFFWREIDKMKKQELQQ